MTHNNIDYFVEQQKTNIAKEKKNMDNNPTTVPSKYNVEKDIHQHKGAEVVFKNTSSKAFVDTNPVQAMKRPFTPKLFKLGEDYKNFRNDLNRERHEDYIKSLEKNKVMDSKQKSNLTSRTSALGMSLPIRDHISAQERLRRERNREYKEHLLKEKEIKPQKTHYKAYKSDNRLELKTDPKSDTTQVLHQENLLNLKDTAVENSSFDNNQQQMEVMQKQLKGDSNHLLSPNVPDNRQNAHKNLTQFSNVDEYVMMRQRELNVYASKLQEKLEAEDYALRTRREADEYARRKKNEIDLSYEELLEKKRREEHIYRSPVRSFYPRARATERDESYYPAIRRFPRIRFFID